METLSPDQEMALARQALEHNDLPGAADHAGNALAADPMRPDGTDLLDRVIAAAADPLALAPLDGASLSRAAVRAYVLAHLGRFSEAIDLLLQLVQARPDLAYLEWAVEWLRRPEAVGMIDLARPRLFLKTLVDQLRRLSADGHGRATLERVPTFIEVVRRTQPQDTMFLFFSASLLRRTGRRDLAMDLAREAFDIDPCYLSAISVALVYNEQGQTDESLTWYRTALEFRPDDVAVRVDIADTLYQHNRLEEAEAAYAEALRYEPDNGWALASYYAIRHQREGDDAWLDKLRRLAEEQPDNNRAGDLVARLQGSGEEP